MWMGVVLIMVVVLQGQLLALIAVLPSTELHVVVGIVQWGLSVELQVL